MVETNSKSLILAYAEMNLVVYRLINLLMFDIY